MYNKDKKYNVKYINQNGEEKTVDITPEEDMSTPQMITKLKEEHKDFFKLIESVNIGDKVKISNSNELHNGNTGTVTYKDENIVTVKLDNGRSFNYDYNQVNKIEECEVKIMETKNGFKALACKKIKKEGYTAREQFEKSMEKYKDDDKRKIKVVAETEHYLLTVAKRDEEGYSIINLTVRKGSTDDHMLPDVFIEQDYKGTCKSAQINWGAYGSCDIVETLTFIKYLTEATDFCSQIEGKDFSSELE